MASFVSVNTPIVIAVALGTALTGCSKASTSAEANGRAAPAKAVQTDTVRREDVKRTVPADKLLVYEIQQGWEPLCDLLGVDVPDEEFPHLNDAETFRQMFGVPATA